MGQKGQKVLAGKPRTKDKVSPGVGSGLLLFLFARNWSYSIVLFVLSVTGGGKII